MKLYHHIKPLQYNRTLYYKIRESILYQRQRKELTTRAIYRTKDNNLFMPFYLLSNAL